MPIWVSRLRLKRLLPFLRWTSEVNRKSFQKDITAGLTNAIIVLPQGVAFALIAGLPPIYGLYTAMVPPIVAALFGSSKHLISGPTTAISLVVFATVSKVSVPGDDDYLAMVLTLTFLAGVYQLILGLTRMGVLVNFVSHSVVVGFTTGAAILILTSQLENFFGIPIPSDLSFVTSWLTLFREFEHINIFVVAVAVITLATGIGIRMTKPTWPGMLISLVVGSLVAIVLGGEKRGINMIGELSGGLPPLSIPDLSFETIRVLGSAALAVAMLGLLEAVSIARSVALKSGQRIDANQEFVGQGLSNIVGSFFSSYASSGSFTRTGVNYAAGAATPLAAIISAITLAFVVLLIAPLITYLSIAAMAAVLMLVAVRLFDWPNTLSILRSGGNETAIMLTTCVATLFIELEFAIYVGVILSLVIYLKRTSRPRVISRVPNPNEVDRVMVTDPSLPECPQLKLIRIEGELFFGAIEHVQKALLLFSTKNPAQKHFLIIGNAIGFIDLAGAELLAQEAVRLKMEGGGLHMVKINDDIYRTLERGGFFSRIPKDNIYPSKSHALAGIFHQLDHDICALCTKRIFLECSMIEPKVTADKQQLELLDKF
ncbi:SulP family inorganic anion transporter [Pseudomonadota bacterium]